MMCKSGLLVFMLVLLALGQSLHAEWRAIDPARSSVTVFVGKSGLLSAFGHTHTIRGPISGKLDEAAEFAIIDVAAGTLEVVDPDASAEDRAEIQRTMVGPKVLDVGQFPSLHFQSDSVRPLSADHWEVRGRLSLRGQVRPVSVQVERIEDGMYRATANLKQSEFGIRPVRFAGGAVSVKDELKMEFIIKLSE